MDLFFDDVTEKGIWLTSTERIDELFELVKSKVAAKTKLGRYTGKLFTQREADDIFNSDDDVGFKYKTTKGVTNMNLCSIFETRKTKKIVLITF